MWLGFSKECMVPLIFLWINLLSLSTTFFWSQLKLWSASQKCFAISFLSHCQFTDFFSKLLSSVSDKVKLFAENFSENFILDDSGIYSLAFPSRTNLKTPKLVKKVITNLDLSNVSDPDCIPVVVLKNCDSEF